jgi:hypothetical protein
MREENKNIAVEITDEDAEKVTGGAIINDKEVPDWYISCTENGDFVFCSTVCKLNGTLDCIEGFCNPSVAKC